jgi:hypothetical protein
LVVAWAVSALLAWFGGPGLLRAWWSFLPEQFSTAARISLVFASLTLVLFAFSCINLVLRWADRRPIVLAVPAAWSPWVVGGVAVGIGAFFGVAMWD